MTFAHLIPLVMAVSGFLTVFALGLDSSLRDAMSLIRNPALVVRSIVSMNVVMVAVVVAAASLFPLAPAVKIAIVALAVSPVPPALPRKQQKAGGSGAYTIGLLVTAVLLAIVLVPASIELIGRYFHVDAHMPASRIAPIVFVSAIVPLLAAMLVRRFAPGAAQRIMKPVSLVATALLIAAATILFTMSGAMWSTIVNGSVVVLVLFTLIGLAAGHLLGGPDPSDRTVLALATCTRHPGIAMAIAALNFPEHKTAVIAMVLLHMIIGGIVAIPYTVWSKRSHAAISVAAKP